MNRSRRSPRALPSQVVPLVFGVAAIVVAGLWWWLSQPSESAVRTEEVSCSFRDQMAGRPMGTGPCSIPEGAVVGPIVLAALGALLMIVGAILYAGRRAPGAVESWPPPPPPPYAEKPLGRRREAGPRG